MADLGAIGQSFDILYQWSWPGNASWMLTDQTTPDYCDESSSAQLVDNICIPDWVVTTTDPTILTVDTTGCISGTTQVNGVPFGSVLVRLYYRPTGELIAETVSDPITAVYTFCCLQTGSNDFYVLAIPNNPYPPGNTLAPPYSFNIARQDHVVPQP